jgi:hypothetical protein
MNVGILYPRSNVHPAIGMDFIDGLKTFLQLKNIAQTLQFFSEGIGFGGAEREIYEKAEKLLIVDRADVLLAYVDLRVLEILKPLLFSSGKLMIVINPGANYPQNWVPQSNIAYLTLHHAFLCWLSGMKAAQSGEDKAVMATSFYDCGYLHTASIVNRFVKGGGSILFNYINKQSYAKDFHIGELTDFLSANSEIRSLLCVLDSVPAGLFYNHLNNFKQAERLHLFVSPMMLEETALENLPDSFHFSVDGFMPWMLSLEHEANQYFIANYEKSVKRKPNIFSLLGWECGQIVEQILLIAPDDFSNGDVVANKLTGRIIEGPRGHMKLDAATHYFVTPIIECSIRKNENKMETTRTEFPKIEWEKFAGQSITGPTSGWTNTYLCY